MQDHSPRSKRVDQDVRHPRAPNSRLQAYISYARQLVRERKWAELIAGVARTAKREATARFVRLLRRLRHWSPVGYVLGDLEIDAKCQRMTADGTIAAKVAIVFPSVTAPHLVSVIVPCFNYGRFVREAVESALGQTVHALEVIVVDDGSTDPDTHKALDELVGLSRVRVVRQANQGLPGARNTGILLAQGEYICCLDADDTIEPTYLELAIAVLEADRSVGFAYSWVQLFGDEDSVWRTRDFDIEAARLDNHTAVSAVYRRDDWMAAGGYRPDMRHGYEDWDFWLRLAALGRRGRVIRTPLFNHRRHGRTMTHDAHDKRHALIGMMHERNSHLLESRRLRKRISRLSTTRSSSEPLALYQRAGVLALVDSRPHLLVVAPGLADGGAEILLLDVLSDLKSDWRVSIVTTRKDEQGLWSAFRLVTSDIIPLVGAFDEDQWLSVLTHVIDSRGTRVLLSHGSTFAYENLPALHARYPSLATIDILHNDAHHIKNAVAASGSISWHVAVSDPIAHSLERYGISPGRIKTIRNGVDTEFLFNPALYDRDLTRERLRLQKSVLTLAWVGRLSEEKRPLEFIKIVASLSRQHPVQALMVGDGDLAKRVTHEIGRAGLGQIIARMPGVPRQNIGLIYACADVLVLTSSIEGLPFTVLEALASGCPVAATDVGDLRSLICPGQNGFLVPKDKPQDLVAILEIIIAAPESLPAYRAAARETMVRSGLSLSAMHRKYRELFNAHIAA